MRWLEGLLCRWGKASMRAKDGGLGYSRSTLAYMGQSSGGNAWHSSSPAGAATALDFYEIDKAIQMLDTPARQAVIVTYQLTDSQSAAARMLGCSTYILKKRIDEAHTQITRTLHHFKEQREQAANDARHTAGHCLK